MNVVENLFVVLHLVGMAAIVGGWLSVWAAPRVTSSMVWGARAQLLTGLLLVGLAEAEADDADPVNHAKVAVKLVVAIAVTGLAEVSVKRGTAAKPALVHAVGGLAILNVLVAVLWTS